MAPTDSIVDELKSVIQKLESKVSDLEARLEGKPSTPSEGSMRMVLMGPPGAGMLPIVKAHV